ncbi:ribonuclease H [Arthrobacter sp. Soil736]|uniref:ribonuclease HI family protein n=1 Tax=Arthrobacter sp. Soil736 TaxID=1736395 RepID=UPI0006F75939|nr:ribonuclease HI family protein [Arthrobacter sp. Soil736]KRE63256.1 ribonuclease H [Arthrobacter sp. Soil736]
MTITAAADGSALGNPGPAGWAWYVNDDCWRAGGWPHGTNNQGELMAVLDLFRATAHIPQEDLRILCDSQYVINSVTKWMPGWKRKGWRKADGKPVLNVDILKEIDRELVGRKYSFEWVKGHAGHDLNEAADERARAVAVAYQQGVAARSGPGFRGAPAGVQEPAGREAPRAGGAASVPAPNGMDEPDLFSGLGSARADSMVIAGLDRAGLNHAGLNGAGRDSATRNGNGLGSGVPESNGSAALSEPDLFSELGPDDFSAARGRTPSAEETVEALERELLRPDVRSDIGRTGVLLHPDFVEIGSAGRIWTRDAMMMTLEESPGGPIELDVLGADRIGSDAILLTYRSYSRSGTALRSSLWVLDGGQWRLRFHQSTPEA